MYHVQELKLQIQGQTLDYITFGSGTQPLIMIQGLNPRGIKGAGASLAYLYRIFTKDHKVFLFDRRPDIQDGITVRELAQDVAMVMDALSLTNAHVLGVSQGGMIAQYLAVDRPDLVKKLVLAVTLSRNNDTVTEVVNGWVSMAQQGDMGKLITDMAEKMYSDGYIRRYRPFLPLLTLVQKPKDVQRFTRLAKACLTCNTYALLDQIHCPVLVLGAEQDQVVTGAASREMAEKLGCSIYMFDHLGHAAYEEAKDFNRRILDFFHTS